MSQENVECVCRLYAALNGRDKEGFVGETHPDFMESEGRTYRGHQGIREIFTDLFSVFPDWHAQLTATDHGGAVVVEVRMAGTGAGSGLAVRQTGWQVLRFRDRKVVWFRGYGSRAEALDAVGLSA
jgi:ketosteroid isomerase-like protein